MTSLVLGLIAAALAVLRNFFNVPYAGYISIVFGIAAWVAGDRILERDPRSRTAFIGRMIGVISTIFAAITIGILIRMYLKGGAA